MKKQIAFLFLLLGIIGVVSAQKHADCAHAIVLKSDTYGPVTAQGKGLVDEVGNHQPQSLYFFNKERNVVWFTFTARKSDLLTLDLIPSDPHNDLDFLLFQSNGKGFCKEVKSKKIKPVRSNMSHCDITLRGATGLSLKAQKAYVHSGPGDAYSKALKVKKGTVYYLVVDDYSGKGTFKLQLHYGKGFKPSKSLIDAAPIAISKTSLQHQNTLSIHILDATTRVPVKANLIIEGLYQDSIVKINDKASYATNLPGIRTLTIKCNQKGYLFYFKQIDPGDISTHLQLNIMLKPIHIGESIVASHIAFYPSEAMILPSSIPALKNIVQFLQENPSVKIKIKGYVNDPNASNSRMDLMLSAARAKAVRDYLTKAGIDAGRLSYKGYGNKDMIYPHPLTREQSEANRRVEIEVVSGQ